MIGGYSSEYISMFEVARECNQRVAASVNVCQTQRSSVVCVGNRYTSMPPVKVTILSPESLSRDVAR
ncbi:uncharacterized protein BDV14DRAFT_127635 [Aspergillus stella-maris]|uniref:uncharacterized protein n=1 Tax=Aspergillus stella-maris TaxID=1810926 RepID=UPI003CCDAAA0